MTASKVSVEHDCNVVAWASHKKQCFCKCGCMFVILREGMRMSDADVLHCRRCFLLVSLLATRHTTLNKVGKWCINANSMQIHHWNYFFKWEHLRFYYDAYFGNFSNFKSSWHTYKILSKKKNPLSSTLYPMWCSVWPTACREWDETKVVKEGGA